MVKWLAYIINIVWIKKTIPDDWRRGIILPFWKNKGNKEVCSNNRGITLLSIPGKLFAMIFWSASDQPSTSTAAINNLASLLDEVQPNKFSHFVKSSKNRRNLISLPTLLLSTSKLPLTQCPVTPCGKCFKSVGSTGTFCSCASIVHRHPQRGAPRFFSVRRVHHRDWREARLRHCTRPLQLCNRPPNASAVESL